jgi:hypothetical protein
MKFDYVDWNHLAEDKDQLHYFRKRRRIALLLEWQGNCKMALFRLNLFPSVLLWAKILLGLFGFMGAGIAQSA